MKRPTILLTLFLTALILPGCDLFQDQIDELYSEVDDLKRSDQSMRLQIKQINSSLNALSSIVYAIRSGLYIKSLVPVTGERDRSGYLITLSNGEAFTIWNGIDGEDGSTPVMGIKQRNDGAYYWTVDGKFLLDADGNPVRADGVTPLFDIRDGFWFISVDGGTNWQKLGIATGEDGLPGQPGDQLFKSVDYTPGENIVTFVLSDGTSITLPCYQPISISLTAPDNQTSIAAGETVKVDYSLSYGNENTVVTASSDGNFIVTIEQKDEVSGSILITCPGLYKDGHVNVMAFDGVGYASVTVITFFEKEMVFRNGLSYGVSADGGTIQIPLYFNFDYSLEVESSGEEWISVIRTKADMQDGRIELRIAKNEDEPRSGSVFLYADNAVGDPYATITITQDGSFFNMGKSSFVFGSDGGEGIVDIWSSKTLEVNVPSSASSWAVATIDSHNSNNYKIKVSVSANGTGAKRSVSIPISNSKNGTVQGTIEILQLAGDGGNEMDLVFEVRANESNDYIVYLPITPNGNDFTVDWGDGRYEHYNSSSQNPVKAISHYYEEISQGGKTFTVTVSGDVHRLCSDDIPSGYRSGIVAVKQWGHTGLTDMNSAFSGNTSLTSLPADETLAFGEVSNFDGAFSDCPRLTIISPHLFDHAIKAYSFSSVFHHCFALTEIPERLFSSCTNAESFSSAFLDCKQLTSVPKGLFAYCRSATDFNSVFNGCSNLQSISSDIFYACAKAENFDWMFGSCRRLKGVPANLFSGCSNARSFTHTFYNCDSLKTIPGRLFSSCSKAQTFNGCFQNCNSIEEIPSGLFDACSQAYNFSRTFGWCYSLKLVPTNLFDKLRKVTNFERTFAGCDNLFGESPYTVVDGRKVHFYERVDYPDYFVSPRDSEMCFENCWHLTDWDNIPYDWRNY